MTLKKRVISSLVVLVNFHVITRTTQMGPHTQRLPSILRDRGLCIQGRVYFLACWLAREQASGCMFGLCLTCHTGSVTSTGVGSLNTQSGIFQRVSTAFQFTSQSKSRGHKQTKATELRFELNSSFHLSFFLLSLLFQFQNFIFIYFYLIYFILVFFAKIIHSPGTKSTSKEKFTMKSDQIQ